jgi:prephenate dehydrogenase
VTAVRTVAVAGLGLIGGSAARDLAARGVRVLAYDRDPSAVDHALREGIAAAALGEDFGGLEDADAVLLAVPVGAAPALLERMLPRLASVPLVTDAGSTKAAIVAAAGRLGIGGRFVGAHPLAGDHRSGWSASREGLFAGATVYLTPSPESSDNAVDTARALWSLLGGNVVVMDAAAHDRLLAWTSHLPHVVSAALANALAARGVARCELGRGGRDVTRLAGGSPEMWTGIARENAAELTAALDGMEAALRAFRDALSVDDADADSSGRRRSRRGAPLPRGSSPADHFTK